MPEEESPAVEESEAEAVAEESPAAEAEAVAEESPAAEAEAVAEESPDKPPPGEDRPIIRQQKRNPYGGR